MKEEFAFTMDSFVDSLTNKNKSSMNISQFPEFVQLLHLIAPHNGYLCYVGKTIAPNYLHYSQACKNS